MADETLNPKVLTSIGDMSGERVEQNAGDNMPRHMWNSLKNGHYRMALAGVAISIPISIGIGLAFVALAGLTGGAAALGVAAFVSAGAFMGVEGFGAIGSAAASRASGLAEKHARILDADTHSKGTLAALDDKLMVTGRDNHYEEPINRDKGKLFSWKTGLLGAGMGAASGAVVGIGASAAITAGHASTIAAIAAAAVEMPIVHTLALGVTAALPVAAPVAALAIAGAATCALFGLTFGIERNVLRSIFDQTDANINGQLTHKDGPDLGRQQSRESDYEFTQHRIRRQAEMETLEKSYNERIAWGAVTGRFKGFAAVAPGALIGAALGAVALGGLALVTGGLAAVPTASLIVPLFAAAGGMLAMKVFSESFMEGGAEATARAIDTEFERNRALRARGITPPAPKETEQGLFNMKAAVIAGAIGAVVGIALAPAVGVVALSIVGIHAAAFSGAAIGASALISGGIGATYGITIKGLKKISKPAFDLYDGAHAANHGPSPEVGPAVPQPTPPAPAYDKVTAEDAARLNDRLAAGSGRSFTQMSQQLQASAAVTVGG